MLTSYEEAYFSKIMDTADDGRLSPGRISVFLMATFIYSLAMMAASLNAAAAGDNSESIWAVVMVFNIVIGIFHLLLAVFFFNEKIAYRFQRLQSCLLCFFSLRFSLEAYLVYFFICVDRNTPAYMQTLGLLLILGGFIFLIISTLRAIKRVKQGHFQKGGKGLYDFGKSKGYISLPVIYFVTVLAGFIPRIFSDSSSYATVEPFIALILSVCIQYIIAMAWPEFFLLAYCKRRFNSFHVKPLRRRNSKPRRT